MRTSQLQQIYATDDGSRYSLYHNHLKDGRLNRQPKSTISVLEKANSLINCVGKIHKLLEEIDLWRVESYNNGNPSNKYYIVLYDNGMDAFTCTCPIYTHFQKTCKHSKAVEEIKKRFSVVSIPITEENMLEELPEESDSEEETIQNILRIDEEQEAKIMQSLNINSAREEPSAPPTTIAFASEKDFTGEKKRKKKVGAVDSDDEVQSPVGRDKVQKARKGKKSSKKKKGKFNEEELDSGNEEIVLKPSPVATPAKVEPKVSLYRLMNNIADFSAKNSNLARSTRSSVSSLHDLKLDQPEFSETRVPLVDGTMVSTINGEKFEVTNAQDFLRLMFPQFEAEVEMMNAVVVNHDAIEIDVPTFCYAHIRENPFVQAPE
jgi:hypothetical protein